MEALMRKQLSGLRLVLVGCVLAAGTGLGQYVEDSVEISGPVGSLAYDPDKDSGAVLATSHGGVTSIWCVEHGGVGGCALTEPWEIIYNAVEHKGYCTYGPIDDESLAVINGYLLWPDTLISMPGAHQPLWDSSANRLYVSCSYRNRVAVLDCRNDSLIGYIPAGNDPWGLELNARHRKLYVRNWDGEALTIIDLEAGSVIRTIPLGSVPTCGYYSPSADKYYCDAGLRVAVISGTGDSVLRYIDLPGGVAVSGAMAGVESRGLVMVGTNPPRVYTIDTQTDSIVAGVQVSGNIHDLAWSPLTGLVYCAGRVVYVIAEDGSRVVATLPVPGPLVVLPVPEYREVYVGCWGQYVYIITDTVTGIEEEEKANGNTPVSVRASPSVFRRSTTLTWRDAGGLTVPGWVYSPTGVLVRTLTPCRMRDGVSVAVWDGRNETGQEVAPGVYFVALGVSAGQRIKVIKMQ